MDIKIADAKAQTKYANGQIYQMYIPDDGNFYIGSTICTLDKRLTQHKNTAKVMPGRRVYSYFHDKWGRVEMKLLEAWPCTSRDELHQREQHWIDVLKPELNAADIYRGEVPQLKIEEVKSAEAKVAIARVKRKEAQKRYTSKVKQSSKYVCVYCNKAFASGAMLKYHLNISQIHAIPAAPAMIPV